MKTIELLRKSANEMFLQGELSQEFITKQLPIDLLIKLQEAIYLDMNIVLSAEMENDVRQTLLLITVLFTAESELGETDVPNVYRLYLKEPDGATYALDEVSDIDNYLLLKLSMFLKFYYEDKENGKLDRFHAFLEDKLRRWNNYGIPLQIRLFQLTRTTPLPNIMLETGFSEQKIRDELEDYEIRMNRKKLFNVKRFEQKVLNLISKLPSDKEILQEPFRFLLDEIANGGINIQEPEDLFPKSSPECKTISLSYN